MTGVCWHMSAFSNSFYQCIIVGLWRGVGDSVVELLFNMCKANVYHYFTEWPRSPAYPSILKEEFTWLDKEFNTLVTVCPEAKQTDLSFDSKGDYRWPFTDSGETRCHMTAHDCSGLKVLSWISAGCWVTCHHYTWPEHREVSSNRERRTCLWNMDNSFALSFN